MAKRKSKWLPFGKQSLKLQLSDDVTTKKVSLIITKG